MSECVHYWIVEPPKGPTAKGKCKHCGEEKEFPSLSDLDLRSPNQRRQGHGLRHWRIHSPERLEEQR